MRGRRKVCKERGSQLSGCSFPNSRQTPSAALELRGHPVHPTPWVQTQGLTGTPSPLASGPKQRHSLLRLAPSLGNVAPTVHSAQHYGNQTDRNPTMNADCSVPGPCLVQTYPDCKDCRPSIKAETLSHMLLSPTLSLWAPVRCHCACVEGYCAENRKVMEGRAGRCCCLMAMSPMKRLSDMMEAECLAEYLEHRRLPVEAPSGG